MACNGLALSGAVLPIMPTGATLTDPISVVYGALSIPQNRSFVQTLAGDWTWAAKPAAALERRRRRPLSIIKTRVSLA
jgi:hypothetical protein